MIVTIPARSRRALAIFGHRTGAVQVSENGESRTMRGDVSCSAEGGCDGHGQSRQASGVYVYKWVGSPVGRLKLVATDEGLTGDPVGERASGPGAVERAVEDAVTSGARRGRAPAAVSTFPAGGRTFTLEARFRGHRLSAAGVDRAADDSVRRNAVLRADCEPDRQAERDARRRRGQRPESHCQSWRPAIASSARPAS